MGQSSWNALERIRKSQSSITDYSNLFQKDRCVPRQMVARAPSQRCGSYPKEAIPAEPGYLPPHAGHALNESCSIIPVVSPEPVPYCSLSRSSRVVSARSWSSNAVHSSSALPR